MSAMTASSSTVQIMGAGALGSLFGALIQKAGYDVVFVARGQQLKALRKSLRVSGLMEMEMKVRALSKPVDAEITFVTVKAYDTEAAARRLSKVDPGLVCSLQNGVGNEETLQKYCKRVLGGVTSYAANIVEPGHVVFAGEGFTYIGEMNGEISEDVERIVDLLKNSGIRAEAVDDIVRRIWTKAVINAAINPITAICRVRNGKVVENRYLWRIAEEVALEGRRVMREMGFEINAVEEVRKVATATAENKSSMLQDIERGKRTEVDFINGAILEAGWQFGLECKVNETLTLLVKALESLKG